MLCKTDTMERILQIVRMAEEILALSINIHVVALDYLSIHFLPVSFVLLPSVGAKST